MKHWDCTVCSGHAVHEVAAESGICSVAGESAVEDEHDRCTLKNIK